MSTSTILVSVIITSYNCERFIEEAVNSVLAQTYKPIELIIVDGGSTDRTIEIVNRIFKDSPDKPIVEVHEGYAAGVRNWGIKKSKGEYIAFLDGDDLLYPDAIKIMTSEINPSIDMVYGEYLIVDSNKNEIHHAVSNEYKPIELLLQCYIHTGALLINRNVFNSIGGFDETLYISEDRDLWFRMALADCKIVYIPKLMMMHRYYLNSISSSGKFRMDNTTVTDRYYKIFKKRFK
jgi:glycosyltransferase involved in cell wall biosynthesis